MLFTLFVVSTIVLPIASAVIKVAGVAIKGAAAVSAINELRALLECGNLGSFKAFDQMGLNLTGTALSMLAGFMEYAQLLVILCAFVALVLNCFKLWFSTIELRKFIVESILKSCIVMALMIVYPSVVTKTFDLATEIGTDAAGGEDIVMTSLGKLCDRIQNIWNEGIKEVNTMLQNGLGENEHPVISEELLEKFTDMGLTNEQVDTLAEKMGWVKKETKTVRVNYRTPRTTSNQTAQQQANEKAVLKLLKNDEEKQKYMKQAIAIVTAMNDVLTGTSEEDMAMGAVDVTEVLTSGQEALKSVFYNPYVDGTKRLSFSTMMKTALLMAEITAQGSLAGLEPDDDSKSMSWQQMSEAKKPGILVGFIAKILTSKIVYKIGMLVCTLLVMLEYVICLIEYYIVTAVSALMIPLFFIDATKQYAMNILKTIFSYAIKIIVTTMMCFFVISMYIDLGTMMVQKDLSSMMCILLYVSTLVMGIILAKNSGKIVGAVMSGNPSMGLGDVAREVHGGMHLLRSADHAVQRAGQDIQKAVKGVAQSVNSFDRGAQMRKSIGAGRKAAMGEASAAFQQQRGDAMATIKKLQAKQNSGQQLSDEEKEQLSLAENQAAMTDLRAGWESWKAGNKQANKMLGNAFISKLTGNDRTVDASEAFKVGQQIYDPISQQERTATYLDVKKANHDTAKNFGAERAKDVAEKRKYQRQIARDYSKPEVGK